MDVLRPVGGMEIEGARIAIAFGHSASPGIDLSHPRIYLLYIFTTLCAASRACVCADDEFQKIVARKPLSKTAGDRRMPSGARFVFCGQDSGAALSRLPHRFLGEHDFLAEGSNGAPCTLAPDHV